MIIKRIAEGKLKTIDDVDRELTELVKQLNKDNSTPVNDNAYNISNTTNTRTLNGDTATLSDIVNIFGQLISDLKSKSIIK